MGSQAQSCSNFSRTTLQWVEAKFSSCLARLCSHLALRANSRPLTLDRCSFAAVLWPLGLVLLLVAQHTRRQRAGCCHGSHSSGTCSSGCRCLPARGSVNGHVSHAYPTQRHQPNWAVKRTPTLAMASPFLWPVLVPYAPSVLRRRLPW